MLVRPPRLMRYTRALIPTLKEAPSDASDASHALLLRAGYVRRLGAGLYAYLPLGLRLLRKLEDIVRVELELKGALELRLPSLLPAHDDIVTALARSELHSHRDLPKLFYQIQTKFRDETRPRGGLLRGREFVVKAAYSFDLSEAQAEVTYDAMRAAYIRIFARMGLSYRTVSADAGWPVGSQSEEFHVPLASGEDQIAACLQCPYAANLEVATSPPYPRRGPSLAELPARQRVHTPLVRSIDEVAGFFDLPKARILKSLLYVADKTPVLVVLRGDHAVNELKLARALGASEVRLAHASEVETATGAALGFAGPVGFSGRIVVDRDAQSVADGVTGAGETDYHFLHVSFGRDFSGQVADLRNVVDGDLCPACGASLKLFRGLEVGQISRLGVSYGQFMNASYLDEQGSPRALAIGRYAIGLSRLAAAVVEQHHDADGISWPLAVAPYQVHVVQLGDQPAVIGAVAKLENELAAQGLEVLIDDRNERAGVKFKDADLIGIPLRVTVGERALADGNVEFKLRQQSPPTPLEFVSLDRAALRASELVRLTLHPPAATEAA